MQDLIYVIDRAGKGPVLGYTADRYEKMKSSLDRAGYRKATIEELKEHKNIEPVEEEKKTKKEKEPTKPINPSLPPVIELQGDDEFY